MMRHPPHSSTSSICETLTRSTLITNIAVHSPVWVHIDIVVSIAHHDPNRVTRKAPVIVKYLGPVIHPLRSRQRRYSIRPATQSSLCRPVHVQSCSSACDPKQSRRDDPPPVLPRKIRLLSKTAHKSRLVRPALLHTFTGPWRPWRGGRQRCCRPGRSGQRGAGAASGRRFGRRCVIR